MTREDFHSLKMILGKSQLLSFNRSAGIISRACKCDGCGAMVAINSVAGCPLREEIADCPVCGKCRWTEMAVDAA